MAWRPHGHAHVNPRAPRAFAVCDRCARWFNHDQLAWQLEYAGPNLQNLRLLVCRECLDVPQPQLKPRILPPDPMPVMNARPEPFAYDNASWITTESGIPIDTEDGNRLITETDTPVIE